jgi:endo-1,4-beta-xylanase
MKKNSLSNVIVYLLLPACVFAQNTLKESTKGKFLMGVALNPQQHNGSNPDVESIIANQFSAIVPENCMKSSELHPEENKYDFTTADQFVAFGKANKLTMTGHCLIWHSQLPRWFTVGPDGKDASPELLKARMKNHIQTVVKHFKGKLLGWDVVNEAFEDNGTYRKSKFYQILGEEFIPLAFQYAYEADPNIELYYNDYNMYIPAKCDAVIKMVNKLKSSGIRIDAVGMQGHMIMESPTVEEEELSIKKLGSAGVKVLITEWDISILPRQKNNTSANISDNVGYAMNMDPYREGVPDSALVKWNLRMTDMFSMFLRNHNLIERVTIWGLSDATSWLNNFPVRGRMDYPMLYDRQMKPKAVIQQLVDLAKNVK